ncbi:MAG: NAD(P)-dependent oxidoreductase [Dehalococcoidia bacterium]
MKIVVPMPAGPEEEYAALSEAGWDVVFGSTPVEGAPVQRLTQAELVELCKDADCIMTNAVSGEVMEKLPNLSSIIVGSIGSEKIEINTATELGILVCNSPSPENFLGVSEATILAMLALNKRLKRKEARLRSGEWGTREDRGSLMMKKTVGIIGLGRVGTAVAKRLAGWDVTLVAYDPYVSQDHADTVGVKMVDYETLLKESDFITLHVVLTPETRGMIGERELRMMKPSAVVINTARGPAIQEAAIHKALKEDWIAGAALDSFEQEPLPLDSPLRDLDPEKIILTPHMISGSEESRVGNLRVAIENANTILKGEIPVNAKNPEVAPYWRLRVAGAGR